MKLIVTQGISDLRSIHTCLNVCKIPRETLSMFGQIDCVENREYFKPREMIFSSAVLPNEIAGFFY